jgi:hypothetical protein
MATKRKPKKSAVIVLLDHVYDHSLSAEPRSWQRINYTMRRALEMAIGSLFKFNIDDWMHIFSNYRSSYWIGDDIERWYSRCVAEGNQSAWLAFESWAGRGPLIADDVDPDESKYAHSTGSRQRERLHVGARFDFRGYSVTVTSFNNDGSCNACAYKTRYASGKPTKRFKIDRDAIIEDRAEMKRRNEIMKDGAEWPEEKRKAFLSSLGNPSNSDFLRLPLKKIESALAKC